MWENLSNYKIVLGSQSPRRVELLRGLDLIFEQRVLPDLDETYPDGLPLDEIPRYIAARKAEAYFPSLEPNTLLITADTLVFLKGQVLGKPKDGEEAKAMLYRLAGERHYVTTGVAICVAGKVHSFMDTATVDFLPLTGEEISYYVERYSPLDKAGAYGIQEWVGYAGISKIEGSFYTVMGLPVHLISKYLKTL